MASNSHSNISTYPAVTRQAAALVDGISTQVTSMLFADKILVTIIQEGRLAQWMHVPLDSDQPQLADDSLFVAADRDSLLPRAHFTPKVLLGGSTTERDTLGQLYATQIASIVITKNPKEHRTVLVGLGLSNFEAKRDVFYDIIGLVMACL